MTSFRKTIMALVALIVSMTMTPGVALAAERVERATTLTIRHINRKWAGLRSFVDDRAPVIGMAPDQTGFFWLAAQGGFGIMTSSSAARAAASLI